MHDASSSVRPVFHACRRIDSFASRLIQYHPSRTVTWFCPRAPICVSQGKHAFASRHTASFGNAQANFQCTSARQHTRKQFLSSWIALHGHGPHTSFVDPTPNTAGSSAFELLGVILGVNKSAGLKFCHWRLGEIRTRQLPRPLLPWVSSALQIQPWASSVCRVVPAVHTCLSVAACECMLLLLRAGQIQASQEL